MQPEIKNISQDHFPAPIDPLRQSISQSDTITIYTKLINFNNLDSTEKNLTVANLPIMLDQLEEQGLSILKPLFQSIMAQSDIISNGLIYKIPQILIYLQKYKNSWEKNVKNIIIPIVIRFLNRDDIQIKQIAGKHLGSIATKLNEKDRGQYILKHVLLMSHDDSNENNRFIAVQLLSNMSNCLGPQLCQQFIGLQFLSLCDDTSERVKKQAIKNLPTIIKMISQLFFEHKILPVFYEKADDSKNWGIRKQCANIIIQIAQFTPQKQRQTTLTDIMLRFTKDNNKWVKLAAYKNLGRFIYYLKGLNVHEKLFKRFLKMAEPQIINLGNQNQIPYSCAFNFPAVVSVMGAQKWPQMYKTYQKLLKFQDKKIKISLSQSLFEIAKIIGGNYTEQYLFPVIDDFLKIEDGQDIILGIVKNMAQIIFVLRDEKRQQIIQIFQQFQKDQMKWRIRESIAKQLPLLLQMYTTDMIFTYMMPIVLRLCSDPVSIVRQQAANTVPQFIYSLSKIDHMLLGLIQSIKAFSNSNSFIQRIQYITICKKVLQKNKKCFLQHLLDLLINLKNDKVINVRLSLAQFVFTYHQQNFTKKINDPIDIQIYEKMENIFNQFQKSNEQDLKQIFTTTQ